MPKLTTPTNNVNGKKPLGAQMSAVSKAVLGLVNLHPNATTTQLVDAWNNLGNTAPSDSSTWGPASRWIGPRVNRLAALGHVINNKIGGGSGALWHITSMGLKTLGLDTPATTSTTKKRPAAPSADQQQTILATRPSGLKLPKTPRTKRPASTATEVTIAPAAEPDTADTSTAPATPHAAVAAPRICKHEPWPQKPQPATPAKPPILSPREQEIAMFAHIPSRVGDELRPYTGIQSQLGSSKGRGSLYGPGSTVR